VRLDHLLSKEFYFVHRVNTDVGCFF
jgi:hypothetical protein